MSNQGQIAIGKFFGKLAKYAAATSIMVAAGTHESRSQFISNDFTPSRIGPISVVITDSATGGCWTNMSESKNYIEQKLEVNGFEITEFKRDSKIYAAELVVNARRLKSGICNGTISLKVAKAAISDDVFGIHMVFERIFIARDFDRFDRYIFEVIDAMFEK